MDTYGTYGGLGADLTAVAWPKLHQVFTGADADILLHFDQPHCPVIDDVHRIPRNYLHKHPVDLLVLGNPNSADHGAWMERVPTIDEQKPKLVIEFWEPWHVTHNDDGPMLKLIVTRWSCFGFESTCTTANAIHAGGVVNRRWLLVVVRVHANAKMGWVWPELSQEVRRPMANCLQHVGVPGSAYQHRLQDSLRPLPQANQDCIPAKAGTLIQTQRGSRSLLHDELAYDLGVPKQWLMVNEQIEIEEEFIVELVYLGVLLEVDDEYAKTNAPTFCLPKPGQPGQWRVLADMKKGRQNESMGADPTVSPRTLHILSMMYAGDYTDIDMSKYVYNFPTARCTILLL
jgi:hypothetical protein